MERLDFADVLRGMINEGMRFRRDDWNEGVNVMHEFDLERFELFLKKEFLHGFFSFSYEDLVADDWEEYKVSLSFIERGQEGSL
jgi:hypothetical protein